MKPRVAGLCFALAVGSPACGGPDVVVHESEHDGDRMRLAFDASTVVTVSGTVLAIEDEERIGGSRVGVRVLLHTQDEDFQVYLAPRAYFDEVHLELRVGQHMDVRGSLLDGDGHRVVIAQSIKVEHAMYPLRDDTGRPKWRDWRSARDWD